MQKESSICKDFKIQNYLKLLDAMLIDTAQQPSIYNPGKYWSSKAKSSAKKIKKHGLSNFRGSDNLIGLSYADNLVLDVRNVSSHGILGLVARKLVNTFPLKRVFDAQVSATRSLAGSVSSIAQKYIESDSRIQTLLENYVVPYSVLGGSENTIMINGQESALLYLDLLEQHDNIAGKINFNKIRSIFEIGGGFGANTHLLIENYPNIRKVFYLDIPPNLYVGTQYLKSFYGTAVIDYLETKQQSSIKFADNDDLEIICIAPWQIEQLDCEVDLFMNAHSFVEMPLEIAQNYALVTSRLPNFKDSVIALTSYDHYDLSTTFNPDELPRLFDNREFASFKNKNLLNDSRSDICFISIPSS